MSVKCLSAKYFGRRLEFLCNVAKACYHGIHEGSREFSSAMRNAQ